ncbi:MAG TPA: MerR family transcriptional regulator [Polyangiaceae bacterium]|jgi:DNA-binding transcriptional MerR regulator
MPFTKADLLERSGLPDRTIRNYMARGLIPRPTGHGLAAVYDDEAMVRAVAIGRMRASGAHIQSVVEQIAGWTTRRFKRYVAETDPKPAPEAQAPAAVPAPDDGQDPSRGGDAAPAPGSVDPARIRPAPARVGSHDASTKADRRTADALDGDAGGATAADDPLEDLALPPGPTCRVLPLLPGLVLMVDGDAPPIVHRVAAEICARYGGRRA